MPDPFEFVKKSRLDNEHGLPVPAPADVVETWMQLAELVRFELDRIGLPASIQTKDSPWGDEPPGVLIEVHEIDPYGVIVKWHPPITRSPSFREKLRAQDYGDPLWTYVVEVRQVMEQALYHILTRAGFRMFVDTGEHVSQIFRVIAEPSRQLE
ncbi:hypothetical protein [Amycolatopsis jejuensis]|uniref:hypothetical protein n=1 Tax=Amycolatopsis jejuensis TaxID=330084 RepID=UPI0005266E03|nr:hypothetical protein [Amycolatopsis jejuensis]